MEALVSEQRVLVTERVQLPQPSLNSLLEVVRHAFTQEHRVVGMLYRRGEDLIIERQVPVSKVDASNGSSFTTPYQCVRNYASVRVFEEGVHSPIERTCRAASLLQERKTPLMAIVTRSELRLRKWAGDIDLGLAFRVPVLEDPDAPTNRVFFCGALGGTVISDVEYAVVCLLE